MPCPRCRRIIDARLRRCPHCGVDTDAILRTPMALAPLILIAVIALFVGPERLRPFIIGGIIGLLVTLAVASRRRR
jgi:hypothetical protein